MLHKFISPARLLLFFKGMAMGAADTVPGVSGGTIAFVTNIYEELVFSIQSCNFHALRILFSQGPGAAWRQINGAFLLTLLLGILCAAFLLANIVSYLLEIYEPFVMAFFTGLILASSLFLRKQVHGWTLDKILLLGLGILLALLMNFLPRYEQQPGLLFIFFSGAIAICAMILPGISGAFILVLLGSYESILQAVRNFDMGVLLLFIAGCASGLIAFSNILAYLLRHFHEQTLAFLLGILLGSLYTIWPAQGPALMEAGFFWSTFAILAALGFCLVYLLEQISVPGNKGKQGNDER